MEHWEEPRVRSKIQDLKKRRIMSEEKEKRQDMTKKRRIMKEELSGLSGVQEIPEDIPNIPCQLPSHTTGSMIAYESASQPQNTQLNTREDPELTWPPSTSSLEQHATGSGSVPSSGAFIEGCDGLEINGGKFNQIYGHHTSVTINVHKQQENAYKIPQQPLRLDLPPASISKTPSHILNNAMSLPIKHETDNVAPPMSIYEQRRNSSHVYAPPNSNTIYEQHLELKRRGFPLWIPEPNKRLPLPYRCKGVNIGDVGIITASGGFSFLFNICLPRGDPINPQDLPEEFTPIFPSIEKDICEFSGFKPESYLTSASIDKINNDPESRGLSFETSAAEGAILTLPEGATALDLENVPRFRAYAAANIESWYRYANGTRGREAKNGEIRLVIGCDKATSWGMAAIANISQNKTHSLKYRPINVVADNQAPSSTPPPIPLYKWEYSGLAEARVGPDLREIAELKRNDDSDAAAEGKYWNQCLFLRTLNPMLNDEVFSAITQELELALDLNSSRQFQNPGHSSNVPSSSSCSYTGSQTSSSREITRAGASFGTQRGSVSKSSDGTIFGVANVKERVTMSRSITAPKSHPSDVLNRTLLQTFPKSRVVITQDADWCSVIYESDKIMPKPTEISERVLAVHWQKINEEDGMIFFEPIETKEPTLKTENDQLPPNVQISIIKDYMAGPSERQDPKASLKSQHLTGEPPVTRGPCQSCRSRKLKCSGPLPDSADNTCSQCQKRLVKCKYPAFTTTCQFCRRHKLKCNPPPPGSADNTCSQCQKRSLKCKYRASIENHTTSSSQPTSVSREWSGEGISFRERSASPWSDH